MTLNSPDRQNILTQSGLKPRITKNRAVIIFRIPSQKLPQGDYYITLFGEPANESVDDYSFRVIR